MRFSRLLEAEYRAYLLEDRFELKRISLVFAILIWLSFVVLLFEIAQAEAVGRNLPHVSR